MYQEEKCAIAQPQSAIKAQWERVEIALVNAHDTAGALEHKIDSIYQTPENDALAKDNVRGEPKTFYDAMVKIAEMAEALENRLNKSKRKFDEAI